MLNKRAIYYFKRNFLLLFVFISCIPVNALCQANVVTKSVSSSIDIAKATIITDDKDFETVQKSAELLQNDILLITGNKPQIKNNISFTETAIIIGSVQKSTLIKKLVATKKISIQYLKNNWEAYQIQTVQHPFKNIKHAVIIMGSDRRGTAFGVTELSKQMGVSPWYWWADVPVKKQDHIYINPKTIIQDAPKVKYRGIFINDEAPALSNWTKEKYGGFNHFFYEKVFELLLRLKANYIWPAMWGNAFYDDDSLNMKAADTYGIVIGTSHHEPLMRAHDEWRRYGKGEWNYKNNKPVLQDFWRRGMQRATNEKIVTVGMRGDGDEPMSRETATSLLENIVNDQRQIITSVTGKPASETPQLWALYKEVQDYYDKGMRVPDDVTLLLCDDNWGNIRRLPSLQEKPRKGGYGIYYHFDYVGDPRNYKWINTNPIPRVWEQMHMAWEYNARQIWIVNVGDIKPMEFPISFFLDYAWNPEKTGAEDLQQYTETWAASQFGKNFTADIANIISSYAKYNGRRKPELLDENTYSIYHYNEAQKVTQDYNALLQKAETINSRLPAEYKDAFYQLVLHPVKASSNLQELYTTVALNNRSAFLHQPKTNMLADKAKQLFINDSLITLEYHRLNNGKWNHMMDQTHIGYTYWQQPPVNKMPAVIYIPDSTIAEPVTIIKGKPRTSVSLIPKNKNETLFYEQNSYVSIEASHYSKALNTKDISWKVLPDHGKTGSAITTFPVTIDNKMPGKNAPAVQYNFYTYNKGACSINAYFSPTLNLHNTQTGLQYAIAIDDEAPQIISINKNDANASIWQNWVANNIIITTSNHAVLQAGKHTLTYWMVNAGVVLQKLVIDFGGVKPSYLGPPETIVTKPTN